MASPFLTVVKKRFLVESPKLFSLMMSDCLLTPPPAVTWKRSPKGGIICVRQTTPYLLGSQAILTQFLSLDRSPPPCVCRVTKKLMEQCFIAKILKYSFEYRHWNASFFVVLREDDSAVMSSVGRNVSFCLKSILTCVLKMRCFRS